MSCPFLEYRDVDPEHEFDHERPYCSVSAEFVSPMKADVCNDRHAFAHDEDCEVFRQFVDDASTEPSAEPTD